jgi:gamma-glutamylcyclotransferase
VWGVLYEIDPAEFPTLDRVEAGYARRRAPVTTADGQTAEAEVYISSDLTGDPRPYDWYKALMVKGAREVGLPEDYVAFLEDLPAKPATHSG